MASLHRKITSISGQNMVETLNETFFDCAKIAISWRGQRLITILGYEGAVEIDEVARKFLDTIPETSLEDRLECSEIWERIRTLYQTSDKLVASTSLYRCFVPFIEYLCDPFYPGVTDNPMMRIKEKGLCLKKDQELFAFPPQEFLQYWPDIPRKGSHSPGDQVWWFASEEMVQDAIKKKQS